MMKTKPKPNKAGAGKLDRSQLLAGKVAVVTGAGSGMGRATAGLMAELGAAGIGLSFKANEVEKGVKEIERTGAKAEGGVADVLETSTPERVVETALEAVGGLGILVNNAAYFE